jgi:hypothetical protein
MLAAAKMFYIGVRLFAVLALQDFEPGDAYVCRMSPTSPAGFDYIYVDQVKAGDVQVRYEDECDAAIQMIADQDI